MCLAIPGKILSKFSDAAGGSIFADVSFGGVVKRVCLDFLPDAEKGQYVLTHVGFAISIVDEKEAEETLKMIDEIENNARDHDPSH